MLLRKEDQLVPVLLEFLEDPGDLADLGVLLHREDLEILAGQEVQVKRVVLLENSWSPA